MCKLLAVTLLAVCIGVPLLEATGGWDRTFADTGDETIIVIVALCVGAAVVAGAARLRAPVSVVQSSIVPIRPSFLVSSPVRYPAAVRPSLPSLRI
jgi:hypothetical protein